jgi:hypothetical protein
MRRTKNPARSFGGVCRAQNLAEDIRNRDVSDIVGVESTILIPSTGSPLNDGKRRQRALIGEQRFT